MTTSDEPAAVRTEIEDLMHRVDELDAASGDPAQPAEDAGGNELALLGRQAELFERAHQLLVHTLDDVDRV